MKITSFLAAFLVANTTVSAAPDDNETTERVSYSDRRSSRSIATDDHWVELASPTPASNRREFIEIDARYGPFVRLRLDATAGRPTVRSLHIEYVDGTQRVVRIAKVIDRRHPVFVDLRDRSGSNGSSW